MKKNKTGYIKVTFKSNTLKTLDLLVKSLVKEEDLYFSDVVSHIAGNISSKAHLTLFYGIDPKHKNSIELVDYVDNVKVSTLTVGSIKVIPGYQNLYQALYLEIVDKNKELESIHTYMEKYNTDKNLINQPFRPHITLAYVSNKFKISSELNLYDLSLNIDKIILKV